MTTALGASGGWKRDRRFFTTLAAVVALVVFAGFAPTYFLRPWFGRPALSGRRLLRRAAFRRRTDLHRRLMLVATLVLLPAAFARLPGVSAAGPLAFFGLLDLVLVVVMLYDKLTLGRVHTAYRWAVSAVILSQPLRLAIGGTHAWRAFAAWVTA
jgi:hypothetical protein